MKLNFKMSELIHSDIAVKYNINNMPTIDHSDNILYLIFYFLQPVRDLLTKYYGKDTPITITGGYRSYLLWAKLRDLGKNPSKTSEHLSGKAADFVVKGHNIKEVFNLIKNSNIPFNQLIYEYDSYGNIWIHGSYNHGNNKRQVIDNYKGC